MGFSCPLCREFVPAPADIGKPATWAEGLPVCKILDKLSRSRESNLCAACQRENEEEEATDICITCEEAICANCAKYHRRNLITCTHVVVPLKEPSVVLQSVISSVKNGSCPEHPDKEVELHCGEHRRAMCTLCATTEHRKCLDVQTVQSITEKTKKGGSLQKLLRKVNNYEQELLMVKKKQENNLSEIDSTSDSILEETKKLRMEVNAHLDKLENEHLNELSKVTKESKDMLNKNIDSVSDRIHFSRHCIQRLQNLEDASDACFMKEYHHVGEKFEVLKLETVNLKEHEIKLKSNISKELRKLKQVERFSKLEVLHSRKHLLNRRDIEDVSFSLIYEIQLPDANICGGNFISDEVIALAKYNSTKKGLWLAGLKRNTWDKVRESDTDDTYFDVQHSDNELYITNQTNRSVIVMSSNDFTTVREFIMQDNLVPYGISIWENFVFVACQIAILKYDLQGELVYRYPVEKSSLYVAVTRRGHIVHSNVKTDTVTCIDEKGVPLWKYVSPKLSGPCSVDRDALDNLYVGGSKSNNVHILSSFGSLIRVLECIPCPAYMKVSERGDMCCVCSSWKNIRVYEIK